MAGEYELLTGYINNLNKWINDINTNLSKYQKNYDKIQAKKVEYTNLISFFNSIEQSVLSVASNLEENANTLKNSAKGTTKLTADAQKLQNLVQELRNLSKSNYSSAYITNCIEAARNYLNSVINPLLENFTEAFIAYNTILGDLTNMKTNLETILVSYDAVKNDPASLQEWTKLFKEFTEGTNSPYQQVALQYSNTAEKLNNYNSQISKMSTPDFVQSTSTNYSTSTSTKTSNNSAYSNIPVQNNFANSNIQSRAGTAVSNVINRLSNISNVINNRAGAGVSSTNSSSNTGVSYIKNSGNNNTATSILNRNNNIVNTPTQKNSISSGVGSNISSGSSQNSSLPFIKMISGAKYRGNAENISNKVQAMVSSGSATATSVYNAKTRITKNVAKNSAGSILGKWFTLPDGRSYTTKALALERFGTQDARSEVSRYAFTPKNTSRTGQVINYLEGSYDIVVTGKNYSKVESYDAGSQFAGKVVTNTNEYGDRLAVTNSDNSKTIYKYNKNGVPVRIDVDENGNKTKTKNPTGFPPNLKSNR